MAALALVAALFIAHATPTFVLATAGADPGSPSTSGGLLAMASSFTLNLWHHSTLHQPFRTFFCLFAFLAVISLIAHWTNPSESSFRKFLTELTFRHHLTRLNDDVLSPPSPTTTSNSSTAITQLTRSPGNSLRNRSPSLSSSDSQRFHFSSRASVSLRTPPHIFRSFGLFTIAVVSPVTPPVPIPPTPGTVSSHSPVTPIGGGGSDLPPPSPIAGSWFIGIFSTWFLGGRVISTRATQQISLRSRKGEEVGVVPSRVGLLGFRDLDDSEGEGFKLIADPFHALSNNLTPKALRRRSSSKSAPLNQHPHHHHQAHGKRDPHQNIAPVVPPIRTSTPPPLPTGISLPLHAKSSPNSAKIEYGAKENGFHPLAIASEQPEPTPPPSVDLPSDTHPPNQPPQCPPTKPLSRQPSLSSLDSTPLISDLLSQVSSTRSQIDELRSQISSFESTSASSRTALESELDSLRSKKRAEDAVRNEIRSRIRVLEEEKLSIEGRRREAERKLRGVRGKKEEVKRRVGRLKGEVERMQRDVENGRERSVREEREVEALLSGVPAPDVGGGEYVKGKGKKKHGRKGSGSPSSSPSSRTNPAATATNINTNTENQDDPSAQPEGLLAQIATKKREIETCERLLSMLNEQVKDATREVGDERKKLGELEAVERRRSASSVHALVPPQVQITQGQGQIQKSPSPRPRPLSLGGISNLAANGGVNGGVLAVGGGMGSGSGSEGDGAGVGGGVGGGLLGPGSTLGTGLGTGTFVSRFSPFDSSISLGLGLTADSEAIPQPAPSPISSFSLIPSGIMESPRHSEEEDREVYDDGEEEGDGVFGKAQSQVQAPTVQIPPIARSGSNGSSPHSYSPGGVAPGLQVPELTIDYASPASLVPDLPPGLSFLPVASPPLSSVSVYRDEREFPFDARSRNVFDLQRSTMRSPLASDHPVSTGLLFDDDDVVLPSSSLGPLSGEPVDLTSPSKSRGWFSKVVGDRDVGDDKEKESRKKEEKERAEEEGDKPKKGLNPDAKIFRFSRKTSFLNLGLGGQQSPALPSENEETPAIVPSAVSSSMSILGSKKPPLSIPSVPVPVGVDPLNPSGHSPSIPTQTPRSSFFSSLKAFQPSPAEREALRLAMETSGSGNDQYTSSLERISSRGSHTSGKGSGHGHSPTSTSPLLHPFASGGVIGRPMISGPIPIGVIGSGIGLPLQRSPQLNNLTAASASSTSLVDFGIRHSWTTSSTSTVPGLPAASPLAPVTGGSAGEEKKSLQPTVVDLSASSAPPHRRSFSFNPWGVDKLLGSKQPSQAQPQNPPQV